MVLLPFYFVQKLPFSSNIPIEKRVFLKILQTVIKTLAISYKM